MDRKSSAVRAVESVFRVIRWVALSLAPNAPITLLLCSVFLMSCAVTLSAAIFHAFIQMRMAGLTPLFSTRCTFETEVSWGTILR